MSVKSFAVVIPAFNPGEIVLSVISSVERFCDRIILVDDGSNAENRRHLEAMKKESITFVSFPHNKGKGHALVAGLEKAITFAPDYIFTIDSDGQHNPDEIPKFLKHLEQAEPPPDLVIGSRSETDAMPFRSKVGNIFTSILFNIVFGRKIVDTQSGFRVFSLSFARDIVTNIQPGRYETEMRMLIYAVRMRRCIHEITIDTIYLDNNSNSKFRPLEDSIRVLSVFLRYTAVACTSFFIDYSIFLGLVYFIDLHYLYAHAIARVCSGSFNFSANKCLVFNSQGSALYELLRYIGILIFSLNMTGLLLYLLVDICSFSKTIAKPSAELMLFLFNFLFLSKLVFKTGSQST